MATRKGKSAPAKGGSFKQKLKSFSKNWKKGKERADEAPDFDQFEDGRYFAQLSKAEINESKSSGRLQIMWSWIFKAGEYKGKQVNNFHGLETEENAMWLTRFLAKLGYEEAPAESEDLEKLLKELNKEKPCAEISLRTRGDYQNLDVRRLVDEDEIEDDEEEEEEDDDEEDDDDDDDDDDEEDDD